MLLQASTEIPFDFAYFAKLYTVALICSHYNGTKEYKQHQQRKILRKFCLVQKKKSIMPGHEHRDTHRQMMR